MILMSAPAADAGELDGGPFISAGLVLSGGSRGVTIGVEVSGGSIDDSSGAYAGAAIGFDWAPHSEDLPVRLYLEGEGGWTAFGLGIGPAFFFNGKPVGIQFTPYIALSAGVAECQHSEPFLVGGAFYRFTTIPGSEPDTARSLHEGGGFAKELVFPNGVDDHGVCTH